MLQHSHAVKLLFVVLLGLLFFLSNTTVVAEDAPTIIFNKSVGGIHEDYFYSVAPCLDGGFIAVGGTGGPAPFEPGYSDGWVVKFDIFGEEEWNKTFGGILDDKFVFITAGSDGGYLLVGFTSFNNSGRDGFVVKINGDGEEEWSKTLGWENFDEFETAAPYPDGGFIVAGNTGYKLSVGDIDGWAVRLSADGEVLWNKKYNQLGIEQFNSVSVCSDGSFIFTGRTGGGLAIPGTCPVYGYTGFVLKTDENGQEIWTKLFTNSGDAEFYDINVTDDGGYILIGYTGAHCYPIQDGWLLKLYANGEIQWETKEIKVLKSIIMYDDGGYILYGYNRILKLDENFDEEWNYYHPYSYGNQDLFTYAINYPYNSFILVGYTSIKDEDKDGLVVKLGYTQPTTTTIQTTTTAITTTETQTTTAPAVGLIIVTVCLMTAIIIRLKQSGSI